MESFVKDLRLGVRRLVRDPSFTVAALFALTLGIGAAGAISIVTHALLFESLPYEDAERIVVFQGTYEEDGTEQDWPISQVDFQDWEERADSFSAMSVYSHEPLSFNLLGFGEPERIEGELVSHDFFDILGLEPRAGRFFKPEEDSKPFAHPVAVLSHAFWRQRYGASPDVVGDTIHLDGQEYAIVGVAPPGFRGLTDRAELWVPSMMPPGREPLITRRYRWVLAVGRLAPGVSLSRAQAEMDSITAAMAEEFPKDNEGMGVDLKPLREHWFGDLRHGLAFLSLGAGLLLLIACANVANLQLARSLERQRSLAVSTALGASRRRLARELLVESLLLALASGILGLGAAAVGTRALLAGSGVSFHSFVRFLPDAGLAAGLVGLALACGVGFGLVPIWVTFRSDVGQVLRQEGRSPVRHARRFSFQTGVAVTQIALTLVLLVGAGLMVKGLDRLLREDLGFEAADVLAMRLELKGDGFAQDGPVVSLVQRLYDRLEAVPGIESFGIANPTVPSDDWVGAYMTIEDYVSPAPDGVVPAMVHGVSPGYFSLLSIPLIEGRTFRRSDTENSLAVVSRSFAERYWPDGSPLGKRFKMGSRDGEQPWLTIVGVVDDVRHRGYTGQTRPAPDVYTHVLTNPIRLLLRFNVLARPEPGLAPTTVHRAIEEAVREVDPDLPLYDSATLEERLASQIEQERFQILLMGLFTAMALVLATIGVYSVVSYGVARRTREIGLRKALGADRREILGLVVRRGALLAAAGLGVGLLGALLVGPYLSGLLHGLSTRDPLVLGGTSVFLFGVTLLASYLPARRAARLDPASSLRLD
ncbi:MAG: ABC transporter permease [Acidobacteriota bacterium]